MNRVNRKGVASYAPALTAILALAITFTLNACGDNPFNDDGGSSSSGGGGISSSGGGGISSSGGGNSSSSGGGISSSGGANGTTQEQAIWLTINEFQDGTISTIADEFYYKFNASAGDIYTVWFDDRDITGSGYTADVEYKIYYADGTVEYNDDNKIYSGWRFYAQQNGTIYVKVSPVSPLKAGTYSVAYTTTHRKPGSILGMCKAENECWEYMNNIWTANDAEQNCNGNGGEWTVNSICPEGWTSYDYPYYPSGTTRYVYPEQIQIPDNATSLTQGAFKDGAITSSAKEIWYSFDVTLGSTYFVYLEEDGLDAKVVAYYSDETEIFDYLLDFGKRGFTATQSGKVYLRASPYYSGETGNFTVKYDKWTVPTSTTTLTLGSSRDSTISNTVREILYSFDVIEGTGYEVYMNDAMSGEGKTLNATRYEACYSDGTEIFYGWNSEYPGYIYARETGNVYLKVSSFNNVSTGTFSVSYGEYEECYECYGAPKAAPKANVLSKTSKISKKK
jgi:hypothetical protein